MITRSFRKNAVSKIISAESGTIATVIDSIIISKFLGLDAIGSYGIAMPVVYLIIAFAKLLSDGGARRCGVSIGKGDSRQADSVFATTIICAFIMSVLFMLLLLLTPKPLAWLLGARGAAVYYLEGAIEYLRGYAWGIPAHMMLLSMIPFAQLEGKISVISVGGYSMAVTDVVLDLANVLIFRKGLWGMAFATAVSEYVGAAIICNALFRKDSEFKFSPLNFAPGSIISLAWDGIPGFLSYFLTSLRSVVSNHAIAAFLPIWILPIYSGVSSLMSLFYPVGKGIGSTVMVFSSVFFGEEDIKGLKNVLWTSTVFALAIHLILTVVIIAFAPLLLGIFLTVTPEEMALGCSGVRIMALALIPFALHTVYKSYMQGIGRIFETTLFLGIYECLISGISVFAMSALFSVAGFWRSFLIREILTLGLVFVFIAVLNQISKNKLSFKEASLLIFDGFGIEEDKLLEASLYQLSELDVFMEKAEAVCGDDNRAKEIASYIQRVGSSVFNKQLPDGETPELRICLYRKEGIWTLRMRDNGERSDPAAQSILSLDGCNAKYIRSLNHNVLVLQF